MHPNPISTADIWHRLPWWVDIGAIAFYPCLIFFSTLIIIAAYHVLFFRKSFRDRSLDWKERANQSYPFRAGYSVVLCFVVALSVFNGFIYKFSAWPHSWLFLGITGFLTSFLVFEFCHWRYANIFGEIRVGFCKFLKNELAYYSIIKPILPPMLFILLGSGAETQAGTVAFFTLAGLSLVVTLQGRAFRLGSWLGLCRPASDRLRSLTNRLSEKTGIAPKSVWEIEWRAANLFFFPSSLVICITQAALECLRDDEIETVLTHEWRHFSKKKTLVFARLLLVLLLPCLFLHIFAILHYPEYRQHTWTILLATITIFIGLRLLLQRLFLKREKADESNVHAIADPVAYAQSLEKIYRFNLMPAVTKNIIRTQPDLYDRLVAVGAPPDYPRPRPKSRKPTLFFALTATLALFFGPLTLLKVTWEELQMRGWHKENPAIIHANIALWGGYAADFEALAFLSYKQKNNADALAYYEAAFAAAPKESHHLWKLAYLLALEKRCETAHQYADELGKILRQEDPDRTLQWIAEAFQNDFHSKITDACASKTTPEWDLAVMSAGTPLENKYKYEENKSDEVE